MEKLDDKRSKTPNVRDWFVKDKSVLKSLNKSSLLESSSSSDSESLEQNNKDRPITFPSFAQTDKSLIMTFEKVRNSR